MRPNSMLLLRFFDTTQRHTIGEMREEKVMGNCSKVLFIFQWNLT